MLVDERAIGTDQDKKFVMVVGDDDRAAYRAVTLGGNVDGLRIVTAGLKAGERVVVNGLQRVRPGALLKIRSRQWAHAMTRRLPPAASTWRSADKIVRCHDDAPLPLRETAPTAPGERSIPTMRENPSRAFAPDSRTGRGCTTVPRPLRLTSHRAPR